MCIRDRLHRVFELADRTGTPTQAAAMRLVQERLGGGHADTAGSNGNNGNNSARSPLAERVA